MPKKPQPSEALAALAADLSALIERHESHADDDRARVLIECLRVLHADALARSGQ